MTGEYRSWRQRIHDMNCPECRRKVAYRRAMLDLEVLVYPEPTEAEIDGMLGVPPDWPGCAA